jgi:hypothetical protein
MHAVDLSASLKAVLLTDLAECSVVMDEFIVIYMYIHTHTHTHIYIYIYIYIYISVLLIYTALFPIWHSTRWFKYDGDKL